jgi:hypothetical protein
MNMLDVSVQPNRGYCFESNDNRYISAICHTPMLLTKVSVSPPHSASMEGCDIRVTSSTGQVLANGSTQLRSSVCSLNLNPRHSDLQGVIR